MNIKLENTERLSLMISLTSTLNIVRDLLKEIPKKDKRYNELCSFSTDLHKIKKKIEIKQ